MLYGIVPLKFCEVEFLSEADLISHLFLHQSLLKYSECPS